MQTEMSPVMEREAQPNEAAEVKAEAEAVDENDTLMVTDGIEQALEARADMFELLATLYFLPLSQEQVDAIADMQVSHGINKEFDLGAEMMARYLANRNSGTRRLLAVDYTASFGGTTAFEGNVAVPYESVFTSESGLLMQESYQQVRRIYRAEGVRKRQGMDFPDDHLSIMFQFLATLSRRAGEALRCGDYTECSRVLQVSADFAHNHIESWFDAFQHLAEQIIETDYYRGVLHATRGFLEFDRQVLADAQAALTDARDGHGDERNS